MGAQNGKDLLIKIDMDWNGTFQTVAGLRSSRLTLNSGTVDVTTVESAGGWRELLGGAAVKTAAIARSGVFRDDDTDARVRQLFFEGKIPDFQVVIPDYGIIEGAFQITSIEYSGAYDGEATYEMAFASAGQLTFTAL
ncbi:MAG: phage major tail protein, TP901-1 family [Pseudomonadota bacterium]